MINIIFTVQEEKKRGGSAPDLMYMSAPIWKSGVFRRRCFTGPAVSGPTDISGLRKFINITEVINYSFDKTLAVVDIPVAYEEKLDKVEKILQVACATLKDSIPMLTEEPEVWGVEELSDSAVIFRIVGKCKPAKHFEVERQMKKTFKNVLDKNGIKIPYMQIEVHNEK